jgi:GAF domain-containing protein/HAMP domain-containing protein
VLLGIRWRSMRAKIIAWSFVPTAVILIAVAWVTFTAYQQVTEDLVIERNQELTRLSTGEFAAGLTQYTSLLTGYTGLFADLARTAYVFENDPAAQRDALRRARGRFEVFDGGVLIINSRGTVMAAEPERPDALGQNWSNRPYFRQMLRSPEPVFSDIVTDGPGGAEVIVVAVPIKGDQGQFLGMMAGMFRVAATSISPFYTGFTTLRIGKSESAYLVDGNGRVIYHSDVERMGEDLSELAVVQQVLSGQVGALRARDLQGRDTVASFAPVPGTPWGLVAEESWAALIRPSQGYRQFLLVLLALGVIVPAVVVAIGVRRITGPITRLIGAAQQVAGGNFGQTITARTGDEVEELAEQFNLMAAQLQESYAHLEQRVADRTTELATLNAIAAVVSQSLDLDEVLNDALDKTLQVMDIEAGGIYLLNETAGVLTVAVQRGFSPQFVAEIDRLKVGEGFSGRVAQSGQPLVVRDLTNDPRLTRMAVREEGLRSLATVPLSSRGKVLGTLFAVTRGYREFTDQAVQLLTSIGHQIGIAVENARLFGQAEQRMQELKALYRANERMLRHLHLDQVLQALVDVAVDILQADKSSVLVWDEAQDRLVMRVARGFSPERMAQLSFARGEGITGHVAASGEPVMVEDALTDPRRAGERPQILHAIDAEGIRSFMHLPIRIDSEVFGVFNVSFTESHAFGEGEQRLFLALAQRAALAIENARLFDAEQRRAEQFRVISEVGRRVTSILAVDEILEQIARLVKETLGYHQVAIGLIEGDEVVFRTAAGQFWEDLESQPLHLKVGQEGLSGWVAQSGKPLLVPDVRQEPRYYRTPGDDKTKSELVVPLKTKDAVIGVLAVSSERPDGFDESDLVVLQSLAHQAAMAIENARLFETERRRWQEATLLAEMAKLISGTLDLDEVLRLTAEYAVDAFDVHCCCILLWDEGKGTLRPAVQIGFDTPTAATITEVEFTPSETLRRTLFEDLQPLIIEDVPADPHLSPHDLLDLQSALVVPIEVGGRRLGAMQLGTHGPERRLFTADEGELALAMANQAALAIENARLFDAEQRRAEQFRVISKVGQRVTSILDIDEVLVQVVRLIRKAFDYDHVAIALIEGDEAVYKVGAGRLWDDPQFQFRPARLKVGQEGITGWVAARGEPLLVPDVSQEPRYVWMQGSKTRSELAVPLKFKENVIGVLDVQSERLDAFDESDLMVLQSLANQAAIAIENARLFRDAARQVRELRALTDASRIISSLLEEDQLLQALYEQITRIAPTDFYLIALYDEATNVVSIEINVDEGVRYPKEQYVLDKGLLKLIIHNRQPLRFHSLTEEKARLDVEIVPSGSSKVNHGWLGVPMLYGNRVLGAIIVGSYQRGAFDDGHQQILTSIANQAAVALENARLYEQARQLAVLEERQRLARDLHDAVTQTLFSASLIAEALPALWESDQEEGRQLLKELQQLSRGALAEMRTLLLELRPAALTDASLGDLLRQLAEAVMGRTGMPVTVTVEGQCAPPPDVHVTLYRIAQEALNNVVKHAQAGQVAVSLRCAPAGTPPQAEETGRAAAIPEHATTSPLSASVGGIEGGRVELRVSDDGRGFDPSAVPPNRLGLGIIRERAQAVGATLEIKSRPRHGTQLIVVWEKDESGETEEG